QAEDGIRDRTVTGVQTCALPIWDLASPQLRSLAIYEPGKPIEETARELGIHPAEIVKLASNENPLGPSPKAVEAMRSALDNAHLDRKSTRLNSSHRTISYAVFCL